jgi:inorganic pyrophosphatase
VPYTLAEGGDPQDMLLQMGERAFPACLLQSRIIGTIEGEQGNENKRERNDHVGAVEKVNHSFADIRHTMDLGETFLQVFEEFFVNYHELSGKQYRTLGAKGPPRL